MCASKASDERDPIPAGTAEELAIQLPQVAKVVHSIKTDDPTGIEIYWQTRFIAAFRRRKFM
jgi:hypothetical protein